MGFQERHRIEGSRGEMGQGVGGHEGDESSPSLCFFFHDGLKWCRRNAIPVQCFECQSGETLKTSAVKRQEKP